MKKLGIGFIFGLLISSAWAQVTVYPASVQIPKVAVAALPVCTASTEGLVYGVTDALAPAALVAVAAGGAVHTLVYCNGTSWIVG